jgi:hypothetical protein
MNEDFATLDKSSEDKTKCGCDPSWDEEKRLKGWECYFCQNKRYSKGHAPNCEYPANLPRSYMNSPGTCTYCSGGTEVENLIKALRFAFLTLGFYGTPYNYSEESKIRHPVSGEVCGGIMFDGGADAREANAKIKKFLPNYQELLRL